MLGRPEPSVQGCTTSSVSDDESVPQIVRTRLTAAGLFDDRIEQHLAADRIRVDGVLVEDLDQAVALPARVVLAVE
jgi:hypothetical protein